MVANVKSLEKIKLPPGWSKLRWPALILAIGVLLLLLPGKSAKEEVSVPQGAGEQETDFSLTEFTASLEQLLRGIEGAGEVHLLLTLEDHGQTVYQTDLSQSESGDSTQSQSQTVFARQDGADTPVTLRSSCPSFRGAVVVCQGAQHPQVVLAIKEAIACATGLGMDRITQYGSQPVRL